MTTKSGDKTVVGSLDPAVAEPRETINDYQTAAEEGSRVDSPTRNQGTKPNLLAVDNVESTEVANGSAAEQNGSSANDSTAAIRECIANAESRIIQLFEKKLAFDQFKEQQIGSSGKCLRGYERSQMRA